MMTNKFVLALSLYLYGMSHVPPLARTPPISHFTPSLSFHVFRPIVPGGPSPAHILSSNTRSTRTPGTIKYGHP